MRSRCSVTGDAVNALLRLRRLLRLLAPGFLDFNYYNYFQHSPYPYSTVLTNNPLTLDIDPALRSAHECPDQPDHVQ
jgi:hypothetical protein